MLITVMIKRKFMNKNNIFKVLIVCICIPGCSSPYCSPSRSKAISEIEQVEQLKKQNELLKEQNKLLERIAIGIETNNSKRQQ